MLIDRSLQAFTPVQVACLRILITGLLLVPVFIRHRAALSRTQTQYITWQSLFGNFIPAFLFPVAQVHVNSATAGIVNSLSPAWAFLLGLVFFGFSFHWLQLVGITVAFGGALLLLFHPHSLAPTTHSALLIVATLCYGLSSNLVQRYLKRTHALAIVSTGFVIFSVPALVIFLGTDSLSALIATPEMHEALAYVIILSVMGSAVASAMFYRLVQRTNTLFATSVTYLMPLVALGWGWLGGEPVGFRDFAGMLCILGGIYLLSRKA